MVAANQPVRSFARRLIRALYSFVRSLITSLLGEARSRISRLSLFQGFLLSLVFVVGIGVVQELFNDNPVLEIVNVPKEFQDRGYTPDVVARRIKDKIAEIDKAVKGIQRQPYPFELAAYSPLPDLEIPEAKVSLKTAIFFVRRLLHLSPDRIIVDVTLDLPTPWGHLSKQWKD